MRVRYARTFFLLYCRQTRRGTGGQVIAELTAPVLRFIESFSSISAFFFADNSHFLIIVPIDFWLLPDLIRCHVTLKFKPIIIILSCSSNMVAEGIRGLVSGAVAHRRQATRLVYKLQDELIPLNAVKAWVMFVMGSVFR